MNRVQFSILGLLLLPGLAGCNGEDNNAGQAEGTFVAGSQGEKGLVGEKGPTGDKGESGEKGPVGDKGGNGNPLTIEPAKLPAGVTQQSGGFDVQLDNDVLEVRAFSPNAVRVRFRPDGIAASGPTRVLPQEGDKGPLEPVADVKPDISGNAGMAQIATSQYTVKWDAKSETLILRDGTGKELAKTAARHFRNGQLVVQHNATDNLYGINEQSSTGGAGLQRAGTQHLNTGDQGHAGAPLVWSTSGYGVLVDTMGSATHRWRADDRNFDEIAWRTVNLSDTTRIVFDSLSKSDVDYFLMVGRPADIFGEVAKISGRSPLFPKWAMGFTNSQWGADNEWDDERRDGALSGLTETKLRNAITEYRTRQIPIDGFTFDLDWMYWGGADIDRAQIPSSQFQWNLDRFPGMSTTARQSANATQNMKLFADNNGIKLTAILKPRIPVTSEEGSLATSNDWWMPNTSARTDFFTATFMRHLNFGKKEVTDWYTGKLGPLVDSGIVGWWLDEFGSSGALDEGNETENLDAQRSIYNWQRKERPNLRVWSINRNFYLGSQRYAYALWSGDIDNGFGSMAFQRNRMLGSVNAGAMQWTMDTGGFNNGNGTLPDRGTGFEDYARWMQFAAFTPIFRVHATNGNQRQPWFYGTGYNVAVEAIRLRYRLIPYTYSYEHQRNKTGVGIVRPLIFDWPKDVNVRDMVDSWMFGDWLLASPVVAQGQQIKNIYLPEGNWTAWNSGETQAGRQMISFNTVRWENNYPVFFRAGAIVPMLPSDGIRYVGDPLYSMRELNVEVFPDTKLTSFDYYDDDGQTYDYETGEYFLQKLSVQRVGKVVTFETAEPESKKFDPELQYYMVKIHPGNNSATEVSINGSPVQAVANQTSLSSTTEGWFAGTDSDRGNIPCIYVRLKAKQAQKVEITLQ